MSHVRRGVLLSLAFVGVAGCVEGGAPPPENAGTYGSPAGGPGTIHVVGGTYGANCGQPRGNVTGHLSSLCEGRTERCPYRVDHRVIGDPASSCQKDYFAEWTCGSAPEVFQVAAPPEAGFGAVVTLSCPPIGAVTSNGPAVPPAVASAAEIAPPPPPSPMTAPPPPVTAPIHVVAGSYGMNCRAARGNTTAHLSRSCEGRRECAYRVDHTVIGDPAYGCRKDYVAEWTCGGDPQIHHAAAPPEAGFGSVVPLSCP